MRFATLVALALGLPGCMPQRPVSIAPPLSPAHAQAQALVTANPDAARVLGGLRARAIALTPSDVSRVDLLAGSPGFAWRVASPRQDTLFIHSYRDRQSAAEAVQRFIATAMARTQIIDWAGRPHLFRCGSAVVLYLGEAPQALTVITSLCGPPEWRG